MRKKYLALFIVMLFALTIFNSTIVAEDENIKTKMLRDLSIEEENFDISDAEDLEFNMDINDCFELIESGELIEKDKFEFLNDSDIENIIDNEDYSKLLEFMGNGSKLVKNAHVNTSGRGLYLAKKVRLVKLLHPLPRLTRLGFFPPGLINAWIYYVDILHDNFTDWATGDENATARLLIEPENGDPPIYIEGRHKVMMVIWQILPVNKVIGLKNTLVKWYNYIHGLKGANRVKATFPWSFEKWRFKNYFNWLVPPLPHDLEIFGIQIPGLIAPTYYEFMFMLMVWPFNVWTSFINFIWGSEIRGMAPFVIYNTVES